MTRTDFFFFHCLSSFMRIRLSSAKYQRAGSSQKEHVSFKAFLLYFDSRISNWIKLCDCSEGPVKAASGRETEMVTIYRAVQKVMGALWKDLKESNVSRDSILKLLIAYRDRDPDRRT